MRVVFIDTRKSLIVTPSNPQKKVLLSYHCGLLGATRLTFLGRIFHQRTPSALLKMVVETITDHSDSVSTFGDKIMYFQLYMGLLYYVRLNHEFSIVFIWKVSIVKR